MPSYLAGSECRHNYVFPHGISCPEITADEYIKQAASGIITLLTHPPSHTVPSLQTGAKTKNALFDLATILHRNTLSDLILNEQTKWTTCTAAAAQ